MQFNAMAPIIDLPEEEWRIMCIQHWPYQNSIQFAIPIGTITSNSPDTNSVAWSRVIVEYNGYQYTITDDNTSDKYIYWELATPTVFAHSATIPTISENLIVVGLNITGDFQPSWKAGQAAVAANTVSAGALDGTVITGATIQTEATDSRGIKLTSAALKGYNGSGVETFSLTAATGALALTGAITAAAGSNIGTSYLDGLIGLGNLNISNRGWVQTCAFSVTDADTVAWGAGVFTAADGTAYNINAGNTGNMRAKNFIYLDTNVSATAYQKTTTALTALGAGKVLVAIARNGTNEATFTVMNGQGGNNIDGADIVAHSLTANELAATAIDAMTVTGATIRTAASGAGIYLNSTDGLQAKDSSDNVLTQIGLDGVTTLKTGTGSERIEFDATNGLTAYYDSNIKTRIGLDGKIFANQLYTHTSGPGGSSQVTCSLIPSAVAPIFGVTIDSTDRLFVNQGGITVNGNILVNGDGEVEGRHVPRYLEVTDADPAVYTDLTDGELVSWKNTDHNVFGIAVRFGTDLKAVTLT